MEQKKNSQIGKEKDYRKDSRSKSSQAAAKKALKATADYRSNRLSKQVQRATQDRQSQSTYDQFGKGTTTWSN